MYLTLSETAKPSVARLSARLHYSAKCDSTDSWRTAVETFFTNSLLKTDAKILCLKSQQCNVYVSNITCASDGSGFTAILATNEHLQDLPDLNVALHNLTTAIQALRNDPYKFVLFMPGWNPPVTPPTTDLQGRKLLPKIDITCASGQILKYNKCGK